MQRRFSNFLPALLGAALMALAACGSDDKPPMGGDCPGLDEECRSCRADGECCKFSLNCAPGSICNDEKDPLFVTDAPIGICIKVICATNADCDAPKTCSLEKICEAPVCQNDGDCSGGNICLDGTCTAPPNPASVASCEVIGGGGAINEGGTVTLTAVAKNTNGLVLSGITFAWASDNTGAASVAGNVATGGAASGAANITASVEGAATACTGQVTLRNFAAVPAGSARFILASAADGSPVTGADVWLMTTGTASAAMAQTGADGSVTFNNVMGAIASVTASKAGWQSVSVLQPGTNDIFATVNSRPDTTVAGGFRGNIDMSATKKADIKLGIAGPAFPANILELQLESIIGDFIETTIDAPDLGLRNQVVPLPGGVMLALGTQVFTDDTNTGNQRCQGSAPTGDDLGCYVARAPEGPGAAWVLAGQLKLSSIAPLAGQLSGSLGGGTADDFPVGELLTALLPLLRGLNHGLNAGLNTEQFAKIPIEGAPAGTDCSDASTANYDDVCQADFSKYSQIPLAASQEQGVLSAVSLPTLPRLPDNSFSQAVLVIGGAIVPGRGLVPLGLSAGLDAEDGETGDGIVKGAEKPFGDNSEALPDGTVPLAMAPPHSGIEGSQLVLAAIALDPASIADSGGVQLSTIVQRVARVDAETAVTGEFLTFPTGTLDIASAIFTPSNSVAGASTNRMVLTRGIDEWVVYAPHAMTPMALPAVGSVRTDVLAPGVDVLLQVVKASSSYQDLFTFGSGNTVDRLGDNLEAFVVQACTTDAEAPCKIQ